MLEPWNDASLLPPPVHTFPCSGVDGISVLRSTCKNIVNILSNQSPLHKESAILSRFAYKFDKKFRNDIGYRNIKKLNVALRRYLRLNFLKDIDNFGLTLPPSNDEVYLPTKQMLEYVLIRLMTFSKVMLRICICAKKASVFYLDRVKCGESHWMSLMPYAVLSRLWSIGLVLLGHCCRWYSHLFPWLDKLQIKGLTFLANNYKLPSDLGNWLHLKDIDNFGRFEWSPDKCIAIQTSLIEDEDGDNLDSILDFVNQLNEEDNSDIPLILDLNKVETLPLPANQIMLFQSTDQGEIVSRESYNASLSSSETKASTKMGKNNIHSPANVTNTKSLEDFLSKEETFRNENSDLSLTKHLSFMQWQALKNSLTALAESLSNNRKIERKFIKIWKQKCIDI